ncbi:MAG: TIGR02646 family protein [Leptospiraceae bacterium]|nr:TIGR02646 family protein [Leptospiraceae bacterium]
MKFIQKSAEPKEFSDWKAQENDDWRPSYSDLSGNVKRAVYESLLNEQFHVCGYCERTLNENDFHIDHLSPQSSKLDDELDYNNFICSCIRETEKGLPLHCGQLRKDKMLLIHPLQEDCQMKFEFTGAGEIKGVNQNAENTIKILGLNIAKLVTLRKEAVSPFLSEELNDDEFREFVKGYIILHNEGRRNPFCSMIEYIFKEYL